MAQYMTPSGMINAQIMILIRLRMMVDLESDSDGTFGWTEIHVQANRVTMQPQIMSNSDRWFDPLLQSQVGTSRNWISFDEEGSASGAALILRPRA